MIETPTSIGSGFIVSTNGIILTNEHVVGDFWPGAITVTLFDKRILRVDSVIRCDRSHGLDLAIIYCRPLAGLVQLPLAPTTPERGTQIMAIGHPRGNPWLVSRGIVSGEATYSEFKHDAASNPGNSGGPVLDDGGRVVGVIVSGDIDDNGDDLEGLNNAIRVDRIIPVLISRSVRYSTLPLVQNRKSSLEISNEDLIQGQMRLSADRAQLDSMWRSIRSERLALDSASSSAKIYNERGALIRQGIESERRELEQLRMTIENQRSTLNREQSSWLSQRDELQRDISKLKEQKWELQVSRLQAGVSGSLGYLRNSSDDVGSDHLLYRTEAYLAIRSGTNSNGHGADLYGISAALSNTSSIEGVSYAAPIISDISFFVDFAERFRVEAGIGLSNGHPLFNHKNYLFSRIRWNWSSSNSVCYGMYGSAMKSNGSDIIGLSAGLYVGLHVKFLRF